MQNKILWYVFVIKFERFYRSCECNPQQSYESSTSKFDSQLCFLFQNSKIKILLILCVFWLGHWRKVKTLPTQLIYILHLVSYKSFGSQSAHYTLHVGKNIFWRWMVHDSSSSYIIELYSFHALYLLFFLVTTISKIKEKCNSVFFSESTLKVPCPHLIIQSTDVDTSLEVESKAILPQGGT